MANSLTTQLPFPLRERKLQRLSGQDVINYNKIVLDPANKFAEVRSAIVRVKPAVLKDVLRRLDFGGIGSLGKEEFLLGCKKAHINLTSAQVTALFTAFDVRRIGRVDIEVFCEATAYWRKRELEEETTGTSGRGHKSQSEGEHVDMHFGHLGTLVPMINDKSTKIKNVCVQLDPTCSGRITVEELKLALGCAGVPLTSAQEEGLGQLLDSDDDGLGNESVDYLAFLHKVMKLAGGQRSISASPDKNRMQSVHEARLWSLLHQAWSKMWVSLGECIDDLESELSPQDLSNELRLAGVLLSQDDLAELWHLLCRRQEELSLSLSPKRMPRSHPGSLSLKTLIDLLGVPEAAKEKLMAMQERSPVPAQKPIQKRRQATPLRERLQRNKLREDAPGEHQDEAPTGNQRPQQAPFYCEMEDSPKRKPLNNNVDLPPAGVLSRHQVGYRPSVRVQRSGGHTGTSDFLRHVGEEIPESENDPILMNLHLDKDRQYFSPLIRSPEGNDGSEPQFSRDDLRTPFEDAENLDPMLRNQFPNNNLEPNYSIEQQAISSNNLNQETSKPNMNIRDRLKSFEMRQQSSRNETPMTSDLKGKEEVLDPSLPPALQKLKEKLDQVSPTDFFPLKLLHQMQLKSSTVAVSFSEVQSLLQALGIFPRRKGELERLDWYLESYGLLHRPAFLRFLGLGSDEDEDHQEMDYSTSSSKNQFKRDLDSTVPRSAHEKAHQPDSREASKIGKPGGKQKPVKHKRACQLLAARANTVIRHCAPFDSEGSGAVPKATFQDAVRKARLELSPDELHYAMDVICGGKTNSPSVSYAHMVTALRRYLESGEMEKCHTPSEDSTVNDERIHDNVDGERTKNNNQLHGRSLKTLLLQTNDSQKHPFVSSLQDSNAAQTPYPQPSPILRKAEAFSTGGASQDVEGRDFSLTSNKKWLLHATALLLEQKIKLALQFRRLSTPLGGVLDSKSLATLFVRTGIGLDEMSSLILAKEAVSFSKDKGSAHKIGQPMIDFNELMDFLEMKSGASNHGDKDVVAWCNENKENGSQFCQNTEDATHKGESRHPGHRKSTKPPITRNDKVNEECRVSIGQKVLNSSLRTFQSNKMSAALHLRHAFRKKQHQGMARSQAAEETCRLIDLPSVLADLGIFLNRQELIFLTSACVNNSTVASTGPPVIYIRKLTAFFMTLFEDHAVS